MSGKQIAAMVRSHAQNDGTRLYNLALQAAAREAKQGHTRIAQEIKDAVEIAKQSNVQNVVRLPNALDDFYDIVDTRQPDNKLSQMVLSSAIRDGLARVLSEQRQRDLLEAHGLKPAHKLLFVGPPGTGKTLTAATIAGELRIPLFNVRIDGLLGKHLGDTSNNLRTVFDAMAVVRGVYFFDEFDALAADRAGNDIGEARRILNSLLTMVEEAPSSAIVVAATNHEQLLDQAVSRRFDSVIHYEIPDREQVIEVIYNRLFGRINKEDLYALLSELEGKSQAEIVRIAEHAAKTAVLAGKQAVTESDMRDAIQALHGRT
ncbi:AAA family ATPase [Corynebacterium ulcerans]|uniref:ATPase n=1 Tax=Corynebacterium ulcerans TaxID=65058 RepID=A0ABD7MVW1_CORUL|nr:ATP-binding protein [Corynebacterium ulcerans]QQU26495.1 ATP-binding protein [Corynebacterium ulcerans]SNV10246.1 ATPase [Corynebacterium ulcerans]SQG52624.1 ATPase [Corynebacterium ulcerans]SQH02980.1 ATPase [Corynebacterium ulcerans]